MVPKHLTGEKEVNIDYNKRSRSGCTVSTPKFHPSGVRVSKSFVLTGTSLVGCAEIVHKVLLEKSDTACKTAQSLTGLCVIPMKKENIR